MRQELRRTLHQRVLSRLDGRRTGIGPDGDTGPLRARAEEHLHQELARTDVLLTSFRPSAMAKLGLDWKTLHKRYPSLSQVAIVGAPGAGAEIPGHDLTYLAENGLVNGLELPATLFADMGGSLMASEEVNVIVPLAGVLT